MKSHQATYPVRVMSRLLGVSASGFYAWLKRPPSRRALQDIALTARIRAIHRRSGEAYGAPSIHAELADDHGIRIGRKRVARLMRAAGLKGLPPPKFVATTVADAESDRALDKVDRRFSAEGPDRLWVADITYVPTWAGFLYLAIALDVWSRRIVGWAMAHHLKTALVLDALEMALSQRRPESVIHHSDRGCQYTSYAFGKRCREAGVVPSQRLIKHKKPHNHAGYSDFGCAIGSFLCTQCQNPGLRKSEAEAPTQGPFLIATVTLLLVRVGTNMPVHIFASV